MDNFIECTLSQKPKQTNNPLSKLGKEQNIDIIIKGNYKILQFYHSQHEKLNTFYLKIRKKVKMSALTTSI